MTRRESLGALARERLVHGLALAYLLLLGGLALVGPSGLMAWSETSSKLEFQQQEIATLSKERNELRNRVALLASDKVDPDLAGELVRDGLNVVHPDDVIIDLRETAP